MAHRADAPSATELSLIITRADGTVEHVGRVAADYRNPIKRAWWRAVGKRRAERRIRTANRNAARRAAPAQEE